MKPNPPDTSVAKAVAERYLDGIVSVERVPKGWSTYVYRIKASSGTYYMRFLPEDASFAAEVLAHNILLKTGVKVPRVLGFEHKNELTGLSVMATEEIPGASVEDDKPNEDNLRNILREAGRQLALIHQVPVDGFDWIDRDSYDELRGVKPTFREYFKEFLANDLQSLKSYDFTTEERSRIACLVKEAEDLLDVSTDAGVLVHGDFGESHIFHSGGRYTGLIDFGEIRGNNRLFDLGAFILFSGLSDEIAYSSLVEGYREVSSLTDEDLHGAELEALSLALRFLGKDVSDSSQRFWAPKARTILSRC